jgi:hypothetical protein
VAAAEDAAPEVAAEAAAMAARRAVPRGFFSKKATREAAECKAQALEAAAAAAAAAAAVAPAAAAAAAAATPAAAAAAAAPAAAAEGEAAVAVEGAALVDARMAGVAAGAALAALEQACALTPGSGAAKAVAALLERGCAFVPGRWAVTGGKGATVSDGQNTFSHSGPSGWIAAATNPLDGAAGRASCTTAGNPDTWVGLALAEKDVSHGGCIFRQAGNWGIECYDGDIRAQGKNQTRTGPIAAGVTVSVEWDQDGLRFFVGGEPRGAKIAWGCAAPSQVRLVACLYHAGSAVTVTS